ncbi:uncharacterized protein B0T15DRAFT_25891 [Chaetomium strumarium]|uniref:Extracellular serine-rich protein n=1 Tax=Chaetomium strumarium TaxID=1170767 RepID=A0AAJ0H256_9PEZI|nr:hypothetical protein B0T15DRAFT_25891 [Chaetomium strumarium]
MFALRVLALSAVLASTATAQDDETVTAAPTPTGEAASSSSASSTTSSSSGPATVTIAVGATGHVFTPHEATAKVGDIIRFNFYPGGHRVARAEFGWPCIPYEYANINKAGFYTGIFEPQVVSNNPPHYEVRVNDTAPIFFYCAAPGSCVDYHMIGVINPNATQSYDAQLEYAQNTTYQLAPGEPFPSETPVPRPTPGSGSTISSDSSSGGNGGGSSHHGLSGGAIAGIAIGAAAVLILGAALIYLCGRRGGFDKAYRKTFHVPPSAAAARSTDSPGMVEAKYANGGVGGGVVVDPKSPGQTTLSGASSTFPGHDNASTLRSSYHAGAGQPPYYGIGTSPSPHLTTPSPGLPQYGYANGHHHEGYGGGDYTSPHASPRPDQYTPFVAPPVELPSGDVAVPTQSPPPGYQGRESWQQGGYQPGGKP